MAVKRSWWHSSACCRRLSALFNRATTPSDPSQWESTQSSCFSWKVRWSSSQFRSQSEVRTKFWVNLCENFFFIRFSSVFNSFFSIFQGCLQSNHIDSDIESHEQNLRQTKQLRFEKTSGRIGAACGLSSEKWDSQEDLQQSVRAAHTFRSNSADGVERSRHDNFDDSSKLFED